MAERLRPRVTLNSRIFFLMTLGTLLLGSGPSRGVAQTRAGPVTVDPVMYQGLRYRNIGPARGGRVTAVAGHPSRAGTFFMGATGGGVWKTESYGNIWENVSDGFFSTGSIGAIDVADSNPDVVYVGTGSAAIRSNVITGKGVYRSDDGGDTWTFVGLPNAGQIAELQVHPSDPNLVFVAAVGNAFGPNPERGIFRTQDGGRSWEKVLFLSDSTGASDVQINPEDPQEIWAGMWRAERKPWTIISGAREGGVYRSRDGGDSWEHVTGGLPTGLTGKIAIGISPADTRRMYVLIEAPEPEGGLYRSDDGGESWRLINDEYDIRHRSFYYNYVWVDPVDPDVLYTGAEKFYRSRDGGVSFEVVQTPHDDNHDLWIDPNDPRIMIQGNDGGANVTLDGGETWSTQLNQPTAEIYQVAVDDQIPYRVYGAQQDNSTLIVPSRYPMDARRDRPVRIWEEGPGCETGPIVPRPGDPSIVYGACKGRFSRFSFLTGQEIERSVGARDMYGQDTRDLKYRFQRVSPLISSQHDPDVLYHASQFVHRTTDEGLTWETISPDLTARDPERQMASGGPISRDITGEEFYSTLYELTESPHDPAVLWAGANDGPVHLTRDGGSTWTDVTPPDLPPGGRVQTIEVSPHDPAKAYVAVLRYMLDDWSPHIYRTEDFGRSWTRLTTGGNGIPADHPTRVVREDPDREGLLYAGTEFGMFVSFDDGTTWQSLQLNLPVVPVTDMVVHNKDLVISTMGRSFWILDDLTPLHNLHGEMDLDRPDLFPVRTTFRRGEVRRFAEFGTTAATPDYPPAGVMIHYYVPPGASEVSLDILDSAGELVRSFLRGTGPEPGPAQPLGAMGSSELERTVYPLVEDGTGMHRFIWDSRYPGVWDPAPTRSGQDGPTAVPGRYQVRLRVDDWTDTQPFQLLIDPRLDQDGITIADLEAQFELCEDVVQAWSEAKWAAARIEEARARMGADFPDELDRVYRALVEGPGKYPPRMLISQLDYLYGVIFLGDSRPNQDALARFEELRSELDTLLAIVRRILGDG